MTKKGITYRDAGVDLDKADSLPSWIRGIIKSTRNRFWLGDIGGFSGTFSLKPFMRYEHPVLSSSTDGVGTKLKIAFMTNKHDTVGIDLVAMVVNDLIVNGSKPLFFLNYISMGRITRELVIQIVTGIANGCKKARCALIGGETAEMPGFYRSEEYDMAGFGIGIYDLPKEITGTSIMPGDKLIGIPSSGLHSNGYSLVRKICFDILKLDVTSYVEDLGVVLGEELLRPTEIYVKAVLNLIEKCSVHGFVNITGGGLPDNFKRIIPSDCCAVISRHTFPEMAIFEFLQNAGRMEDIEMLRTFNNGVGFSVVVSENDCDKAMSNLESSGVKPFYMGEVIERVGKQVQIV